MNCSNSFNQSSLPPAMVWVTKVPPLAVDFEKIAPLQKVCVTSSSEQHLTDRTVSIITRTKDENEGEKNKDEQVQDKKRGRNGSETDVAELEFSTSYYPSLSVYPLTVSESDFFSFLREIQNSKDPFMSLTKKLTRFIENEVDGRKTPVLAGSKDLLDREGYWSCIIRLDSGVHLECQLAIAEWSSSCFAKDQTQATQEETDYASQFGFQEGDFRYIELFEHDPVTRCTENKSLVGIRMSPDYETGEWLWINRGEKTSGKDAQGWAEHISRVMKIKTCYLGDCAKVTASDGERDIAIRISLQIMYGGGYYRRFSLFQTEGLITAGLDSDEEEETHDIAGKKIKTEEHVSTEISGPADMDLEPEIAAAPIRYDQDVKKHKKELKWLQQLKVQTIFFEILKHRAKEQREFGIILERYALPADSVKLQPLFARCNWSFQELLKILYARKDEPQALADYEWVFFNLLDFVQLSDKSSQQKRFLWIVEKLFFNMLMSASFASG